MGLGLTHGVKNRGMIFDRVTRVEAPAFMRGKERFSAPGKFEFQLCALALA